MKKFLLIIVAAIALTGCYDSDGSKKILDDQGYTDVKTNGHAWFACSDDDNLATSFEAVSPAGKPVAGAVCSGFLFKNATIRFN